MAKVTIKNLGSLPMYGNMPDGNLSRYVARLQTTSTGALVGGNSTSALAVNDVAQIGILPAGIRLDDAQVIVSNAFPASCTCSVGFAYVDGVDSTSVPQTATHFGSNIALWSAARVRCTASNAPVVLPKDAYLTVKITGAAVNEVGIADVIVDGEFVGVL